MTDSVQTLKDLAAIIRSKNAGPYYVTFDVLFRDKDTFDRVRASGAVTCQSIAAAYSVPERQVVSLYEVPMALALKFTISRNTPQGDIGDTDVYGAQQHVPLMNMTIS